MRTLVASRNSAAADLFGKLARIAPTDLPVLLEGETGTGKSFVARALHRRSRPRRPLVEVDCGAVPDSLLASELFGHCAGAFTDAGRARSGRLVEAGDGTLVLDRVEALSPAAQVALLRVLEEHLLTPVGAQAAVPFRARVVALLGAAADGERGRAALRADLYHRLAGFHAVLPPLRRRREDILPFAERVLGRLQRTAGMRRELAPECRELLLAYPWPGNYRELKAVLERAALSCDEAQIAVAHLDLRGATWPEVEAWAAERLAPLREVSRAYALWVLARMGGNASRAAEVLGVSRRTLIRWRQDG